MKKISFLILTVCLGMIFNQNTRGEDSLTRDIELLKNGDDETREDSARRLGDYREKEAVDALCEALHDTNEDVVEEALASLGRIGNSDAVEKIVPVLSHDDIGIRRSAVRALKKIGDPRALPALEKMLDENKNPFIERPIEAAIESLKAAQNAGN